ncbi:MAG: hypothetical protein JNK78_07890 [Planctomycetes bacterium]|nr:hypothetical protein [Planctomycetota bacterium]
MAVSDDTFSLLDLLGRAHPLLLHAPLGLLPGIALLEYGSALLRRPAPRGSVLTLAVANALAAALSVASGLLLAREGYTGSTLETHKILGIALAALSLVAALLAFRERRGPFRVVLFLALGVMVPAGHLGGTLTHGDDFLFPKAKKTSSAPAGPAGPATAAGSAVRAPTPGGDYERVVAPFLARTCKQCHGPDKHKGDLVLTTIEGIETGGENGAVLVAGKPDDSPMLTHCELPLDHDDHMPPEEKPQPTKEELAALRAWIAAGAKF